MAKYDGLRDYLIALPADVDSVTMSFAEVEALVGPLPPSARKHPEWWSNDSKVEAVAWRSAGWHVESKHLDAEWVRFERGAKGGTRAARLAAGSAATPAVTDTLPVPVGDMSEATVQALLVAHLVGDGWRIQRVADTATKERGIDVLDVRDGRTLAVEVKGFPFRGRYSDPARSGEVKPTSLSVQARQWFGQAVLKAMLTRDEFPDYEVGIGLPDVPTYRNLCVRTRESR